MPKVLITGANGFVGIWVVQRFLAKGYNVIGTVRNSSKITHLKEKVFKTYADSGKLELVVVDDITKPGVFEPYLKDVDHVAHTASPFNLKLNNADDVIRPAVEGTKSILESINKVGTNVKSVVVTSSIAAIVGAPKPGLKLPVTEAEWNDASIEEAEKDPKNSMALYQASKTLAERAAWDAQKGQKWTLATLTPPFVFGPAITDIRSVAELNSSSSFLFRILFTKDPAGFENPESFGTQGVNYVDVRDLANAHVLAVEIPEAAGKRFLITAGAAPWQRWLDAAHALPANKFPTSRGIPGAGSDFKTLLPIDASRSKDVLGLKYTAVEDTLTSIYDELARLESN